MNSTKKIRKPLPKKQNSKTSLTEVSRKPYQQRSFDIDTGLVYDETEIHGPKSSSLGWIGEYATPNIVRTRKKPNEQAGARRLYDMILLKLGIESQDLTVEALQYVPWTVGQQIWDSIDESHTESFYIWRTFAIVYGRDFSETRFRYFLNIKSPSLVLSEYFRGITSSNNEWLTCLRVSPKQMSASDLVSISNVSNLTVLDLSDGQHSIENRDSNLDFRVMRSWSEMARFGRAFRNLRVLMLGWQEKVDTWIFDLLDEFPQLRLLVMTRCRNFDHKTHRDWEDQVWSHHWTFMPSKRGVKHLRTLLDDKSLRLGKVAEMHPESGRDATESDSQNISAAPKIPLLEVWIGTPRPWTHIMDEYAGTGTLCFRKKRPEKRNNPIAKAPEEQTSVVQQVTSTATSPGMPAPPRQPKGPQRREPKRSLAGLLAELDAAR